MLDEAIAKLGLTPDELARAPAPVAVAAGYKKFPENTHAVTQRLQKRAAQIERLEGRLKCLVKMESPPVQIDEAKENLVATKRLFQDVRRRAERIEESYPVSVWEEDPSQWEHEMSPLMTTLKIVDEDMTDLRHWCDRHQTW